MSRLFSICSIVVGILMLLGSTAAAQRSGFIDSDKIQQNYKEWSKAMEQFNTEVKAWEDEAGQMELDLKELLDDYQKHQYILSADKKVEREAAISAKEQALASFTKDISAPGGRAERRYNELLSPLFEKITAAIEKIAIDENYDFIFNSAGLAYARKDLDITDKVIEMLEAGE